MAPKKAQSSSKASIVMPKKRDTKPIVRKAAPKAAPKAASPAAPARAQPTYTDDDFKDFMSEFDDLGSDFWEAFGDSVAKMSAVIREVTVSMNRLIQLAILDDPETAAALGPPPAPFCPPEYLKLTDGTA